MDAQTAHLTPVIRSILETLESSFLLHGHTSFELNAPDWEHPAVTLTAVHLKLPWASVSDSGAWLNHILDSTSSTHSIDLTILENARSPKIGASFLNKMDQVTSLTLDTTGSACCSTWMDYLSESVQSNNIVPWPFPNLTRLVIADSNLSPRRCKRCETDTDNRSWKECQRSCPCRSRRWT